MDSTNFNTVDIGKSKTASKMTPLTDWLKQIRGNLSRSERLTQQLPEDCVFIGGRAKGVYRQKKCDCVPKVNHGPHWVPDHELTRQYVS